ncbi:cytochrome P450 family protein [Halalkalicoccus subterraneus]|uniref:cytochrome P450 n=1 Tax=Halalkalicoccus subterraneus TaxID=2675002 RepID=UPI001FEC79DB|nr:cytochrome P450 [Halalkalicoccus subterraneus]
MITTDPPEHNRLRGFIDERFQPGAIREYQLQVEKVTAKLLDDLDNKQQFDFVNEFAIPVPVIVIAELLGIPADRREQFKEWSDALVSRPEDDTQEEIQRVQQGQQQAQQKMERYFAKLLEERQGGDGDDLVTLAANAEDLSRGERVRFCILLLLAGNITTTNLLTNTIWSLEEAGITNDVRTGTVNREQAIEAALRYRSPIQSLKRIATEDVKLNDQHIQTGDVLTLCLGAHLARMEADVALGQLLERFDRLDADLSDLQPLSSLYSLESLPCDVRIDAHPEG